MGDAVGKDFQAERLKTLKLFPNLRLLLWPRSLRL